MVRCYTVSQISLGEILNVFGMIVTQLVCHSGNQLLVCERVELDFVLTATWKSVDIDWIFTSNLPGQFFGKLLQKTLDHLQPF